MTYNTLLGLDLWSVRPDPINGLIMSSPSTDMINSQPYSSNCSNDKQTLNLFILKVLEGGGWGSTISKESRFWPLFNFKALGFQYWKPEINRGLKLPLLTQVYWPMYPHVNQGEWVSSLNSLQKMEHWASEKNRYYIGFLAYVTFIYDFWINSLIYIAMLYIILKRAFCSIESCYLLAFSISSFIFLQAFRQHGQNSNPHHFLVPVQLGWKAAETARDINDAFGPGTTNEHVAQRWFKKFRNGDESLEDEDGRGQPTAVDNKHLKALIEADPCKTTREVAVENEVDHSIVVCHLKQIGKSKKLDKWVPHELNDNKKNRCFEVSSTLLRNKNNPFLEWIVTCDEKWILYDNRPRSAQWLDAGKAPQHFPKLKLHQKKVMVTIWWSVASLIHHSFLNPGKTITAEKYCRQIDEMHQNSGFLC